MSAPVPPSFKDLGKAANDLLDKDYPQLHQLEVKTKAPNNVAFRSLVREKAQGKLHGELEVKFNQPKQGLAVTSTWDADNVLKTQIELENNLAKGLKLEAITIVKPGPGGKASYVNGDLTGTYKQPSLHSRIGLAGAGTAKNIFNLDTVLGRDGFLLGGSVGYNVKTSDITTWNLALGFSAPEYQITLRGLNALNAYQASYFQRVNRDVEAGAKLIYNPKTAGTQDVAIEVGGKAYLDNAAFVKGKINNLGVLVLGYTTALRPGLRASWGLTVDTKKLNSELEGGKPHQIGWSITFEG